MWPVASWFFDVESYETWSSCQAHPVQPEVESNTHLLIRLGSASALVQRWLGLCNRA